MRPYGAIVLVFVLAGCAHHESAPPPAAPRASTPPPPPHKTAAAHPTPSPAPHPAKGVVFERGFATWYGKALAGHHTASGERFDPSKLTAAHRTLKLGTWLEVRRTDNGRIVRVKVNDRGPVSHKFVIDLSSEAARRLGMLRMGVAPVELRIVGP